MTIGDKFVTLFNKLELFEYKEEKCCYYFNDPILSKKPFLLQDYTTTVNSCDVYRLYNYLLNDFFILDLVNDNGRISGCLRMNRNIDFSIDTYIRLFDNNIDIYYQEHNVYGLYRYIKYNNQLIIRQNTLNNILQDD